MEKILLGLFWLFPIRGWALEMQYPLQDYSPGSFQGRVFGCCSPRHLGEDHAAAPLTPVYAIADGQVLTAEASGAHCNFGMVVIIEHTLDDGGKFVSLYGHLSNREGYRPRLSGRVQRGDVIGYVGHSGGIPPKRQCLNPPHRYDDENGDGGSHLHFAIRRGSPPKYPDGRYRWLYYGYAGHGQDVDFDAAGRPHGGMFTSPARFLEERGVGSVDADNDGWIVVEGDCMDEGETPEGVPADEIHPDADEVCNYADDNCDGIVDEGYEGVLEPCDGDDSDLCEEGVWVCTEDDDELFCTDTTLDIPEICNSTDDDCDGQVDENPEAAVSCDDGSACWIDRCEDGVCAYSWIDCTDDNGCTLDSCDRVLGCQFEVADIDDADPCTVDTCDPENGNVYHTPIEGCP